MTRMFSFAVLGVAALGCTLASPAVSHAQSFGVHLDVGRTHIEFGRNLYPGYSYYPAYPPISSLCLPSYGHSHHHHGGIYSRPAVVPSYYHWTPDRGYHSHGTIVTPHRGHYHARPY